ncbi:MAG: NUDIX hydrolase [Xanthobacteraceae bacterium]|nr:NUDIX hydrolase [Xanthobacteraceae bacterium]PWB59509.1 MAG: NUDIX hydrolase [Bradyrhizobiaceae bacterium]
MTNLAERLTRVERDQSFANSRPKDAATLIIVDRSGARPKVLLGRRHESHRFMPGKFVFPGGRVEPLDRLMPTATGLDPHVEARLMRYVSRPTPSRAQALALAAIRETFEETGLMLGRRAEAPVPVPGGPWAAFAEARVLPDLASLHFIVRAITPPRRPRRFDARFFAADASLIAHRVDGIVGPDAELTELIWIPIAEAKRLDMPTITQVALEELESRVARGLGHDLPSPFYRMLQKKFVRANL